MSVLYFRVGDANKVLAVCIRMKHGHDGRVLRFFGDLQRSLPLKMMGTVMDKMRGRPWLACLAEVFRTWDSLLGKYGL
jgi:hypothetical protein